MEVDTDVATQVTQEGTSSDYQSLVLEVNNLLQAASKADAVLSSFDLLILFVHACMTSQGFKPVSLQFTSVPSCL